MCNVYSCDNYDRLSVMHKIKVLSMSQVTIFVYYRSTLKLTLNLLQMLTWKKFLSRHFDWRRYIGLIFWIIFIIFETQYQPVFLVRNLTLISFFSHCKLSEKTKILQYNTATVTSETYITTVDSHIFHCDLTYQPNCDFKLVKQGY